MNTSTLSFSEIKDNDGLKPGSLWIRTIASDSGAYGEIIKIKYIESRFSGFSIYFKDNSERMNTSFSKNFIQYFGTKEAKLHDTKWLKENYKG